MDLEFNIIGFGYTKSGSGINLLLFGTTLVYWASIYHQFLIHSTVKSIVELAKLSSRPLVKYVWLIVFTVLSLKYGLLSNNSPH